MPLKRGASEDVIAQNIRELRAAGHTQAVAVAIAERMADESRQVRARRRKKSRGARRRARRGLPRI